MTMQKALTDFLRATAPFAALALLWEVSARLADVDRMLLPTPSDILATAWNLTVDKDILGSHIGASLWRLGVGYTLAVAGGLGIGALLALNRTFHDMFSPLLSLLMAVPTIAWVPLLLMVLGLGDTTVVATIFLGGFFEIAYSTTTGIRTVPKQMIHAARTMGVGRAGLFTKVLLPASLASVMPTLRLCLGYCWRALVGGEMLSSMIEHGMGKLIYDARFWNDMAAMFLGLILIGVFGVLLDRLLLQTLEKRTIARWGMLGQS